jgi:hypothetical protein
LRAFAFLMSKTLIGTLFILAGLAYGSLAIDAVYFKTLGYLVEHEWVKPPPESKSEKSVLGRKTTILLYSFILIIIGIFILWKLKA